MPVRTLSRYAGRRLLARSVAQHPVYRYARAARTAYKVGRAAYPYIRKAMKKRSNYVKKRRLRQKVGEPIGKGSAKRVEMLSDSGIYTRTLYSVPLLDLSKGTGLSDRERDIINFRGIKFCLSFVNNHATATSDGQRVYFNYAIISPKDSGDKATVSTTDFFRANGVTRSQDFATALTALEFKCASINTDIWNVHKHVRTSVSTYSSNESKNAFTKEFYFPLKRQIRYDGTTTTPVGKQMFLVYWCDIQDTPATSIAAAIGNMQTFVAKYFQESKKCC